MFSAKKLILIGFIAILLIAIPLTVYILQQQQEVRSQAQAATTVSFSPNSTIAAPLPKSVDDVFSLDLTVDPSTNLVSFVRLEIQYDPTKLATVSAEGVDAFVPNTIAFPSVLEGPIYEEGRMAVTLSVGSDPTKAIQTTTKIGTITFKALAATETPTQVTYGVNTQVLSIGSSDQASENVLATKTPAVIQITGESTVTPSPTEDPTITPTPTLTTTPSPSVTLTPTPSASPTASNNVLPICTLFTADVASGSAPLLVNFNLTGEDTDGTVEQVTFNYGDGQVTTITESLSTSTIQTSTAHTYNGGGTFTASAVLTDSTGAVSTDACSQIISVEGDAMSPTPTLDPLLTATPTIEAPGPGATVLGIGAFFTMLSVIGAILFFAL